MGLRVRGCARRLPRNIPQILEAGTRRRQGIGRVDIVLTCVLVEFLGWIRGPQPVHSRWLREWPPGARGEKLVSSRLPLRFLYRSEWDIDKTIITHLRATAREGMAGGVAVAERRLPGVPVQIKTACLRAITLLSLSQPAPLIRSGALLNACFAPATTSALLLVISHTRRLRYALPKAEERGRHILGGRRVQDRRTSSSM